MAEIIDLTPYLTRGRVDDALQRLLEAVPARPAPTPESLGWVVAERADDGGPVRWYHVGYRAMIGFVPGAPELVYLDYKHEIRAWTMEIGELVAGIETGTLPEPEYALDWLGSPLD